MQEFEVVTNLFHFDVVTNHFYYNVDIRIILIILSYFVFFESQQAVLRIYTWLCSSRSEITPGRTQETIWNAKYRIQG